MKTTIRKTDSIDKLAKKTIDQLTKTIGAAKRVIATSPATGVRFGVSVAASRRLLVDVLNADHFRTDEEPDHPGDTCKACHDECAESCHHETGARKQPNTLVTLYESKVTAMLGLKKPIKGLRFPVRVEAPTVEEEATPGSGEDDEVVALVFTVRRTKPEKLAASCEKLIRKVKGWASANKLSFAQSDSTVLSKAHAETELRFVFFRSSFWNAAGLNR